MTLCPGNFTGNAIDAGDVTSPLNSVDVVIQTLDVPMKHLLGSVLLFPDATSVLVPAMAKFGGRRILAVTGFGESDSRPSVGLLQRLPFRLMLGRACDDKDAQELRISRSGPAWTLVRPGILTRRRRHGPLRGAGRAKWRNGLVASINLAAYIIGQIAELTQARWAVVIV